MTNPKIVVVTGANRGIGLAICEKILQNHSPVKLYACSRAGKDLGLKPPTQSSSSINYPTLDITSKTSIQTLASSIKSHDGHVDVLINNAGTNLDVDHSQKPDPTKTSQVVQVNYYGTLDMCSTFLPLLSKSGGRIVNVSSIASELDKYDPKIQSRFRNPNLTLPDLDQMNNEYMSALKSGDIDGWFDGKGYCFSKSCVNAMTAIMARENPDMKINCCCPGWVDTDMGRMVGQPSKTVEEGARIPVRLGFGDLKGVSGRYWSNPGVSDTGDGRVVDW